MYCQNCGKKQENNENFCTNCGTKYRKTENLKNISEETQVSSSEKSSSPQVRTTSFPIIGIIALIFFWIPIISIPLAIISIVTGNKYEKETNKKTVGKILGIISLILSIIEIILITCFIFFLISWGDESEVIEELEDEFYKYYDEYFMESEESFDIRGYSWTGTDQSILYLNKDKTYTWYQDDSTKSDNFYSGTYEFYTGNNAIIYITDNLKEYGLTEEEQRGFIQSGGYKLKDYYLIILKCDKVVINGKEQILENNTIYYYGFYKEYQKYLDLVNMGTSNYAGFTLRETLSSIDI